MNAFTPFRLVIPRSYFEAMVAHALAEAPAECCGFLAGRITADGARAEVTHRYSLVNELGSPSEFLSEPRSTFAAYKDMRIQGTDVLAVYHSHPTSRPVPSRKDLDQHYYGARVVCLIIGLSGTVPEVGVWSLTESDYREAAWEIS